MGVGSNPLTDPSYAVFSAIPCPETAAPNAKMLCSRRAMQVREYASAGLSFSLVGAAWRSATGAGSPSSYRCTWKRGRGRLSSSPSSANEIAGPRRRCAVLAGLPDTQSHLPVVMGLRSQSWSLGTPYFGPLPWSRRASSKIICRFWSPLALDIQEGGAMVERWAVFGVVILSICAVLLLFWGYKRFSLLIRGG